MKQRRAASKAFRWPDEILIHLLGYDRIEAATRDASNLYFETNGFGQSLFPVRIGESSEKFFRICGSSQSTNDLLRKYLLLENNRYDEGIFSGYDRSLAGLLGGIADDLIRYGVSYREIIWDQVEISGETYVLPVGFEHLRPELMKVMKKRHEERIFRQRYSHLSYAFDLKKISYSDNQIPRTHDFSDGEVLFCKYPFGKSPTSASLKFLPAARKLMSFGLHQAQAGAEPENFSLPLVRARFRTFQEEKDRHDLTRAKIKTIFHDSLNINGVKLTSYYDIFTVIRHKQYLNDMRAYVVKEFNKKVMKEITQRNGFLSFPKLQTVNLKTNQQLRSALSAYAAKQKTVQEVIEEVIKPY